MPINEIRNQSAMDLQIEFICFPNLAIIIYPVENFCFEKYFMYKDSIRNSLLRFDGTQVINCNVVSTKSLCAGQRVIKFIIQVLHCSRANSLNRATVTPSTDGYLCLNGCQFNSGAFISQHY